MTVHQTRIASLFDAAREVTLRSADAGAETHVGVTAEDSFALRRFFQAPWCAGDLASQSFEIEFTVTAIDVTGGATYDLLLLESETSGGTLNEVARLPNIRTTGVYRISVPAQALKPSSEWIRCAVEISDHTPCRIDYSATLVPNPR